MHNKELITKKKNTHTHTQTVNYNCINKPDCPLPSKCQITSIIYRVKITSNLRNYHGNITKVHLNSNMETRRNHLIMKNIVQIQNIRRNIGDLKTSKDNLKYNFFILKRCRLTKRTSIFCLCLKKKPVYH